MEHCKKLVLVPHETLDRLHEKPMSRTGTDVMGELDTDMHKILLQKAEDSEKWKLYHQALQRYLHFANEQRKPLSIQLPSIEENAQPEDKSNEVNGQLLARLTSVIPKKFQNTATGLFQTLSSEQNKTLLYWDHTGVVKINDTPIPQSNIIDLVSDAVRNRKTAQAIGWQAFASTLKQLNVPMDLISNSQYKEFIRTQTGRGTTSARDESGYAKPYPKTSGRRRPAAPRRTKTKTKNKTAQRTITRTPKGWSRFWSTR